jgi:hypothetical protein
MPKNVLIVSPTPTHPTNAGNRKHIFNLVNELKDLNHEVFFFFINREEYDSLEMQEFFNNRLYIFDESKELSLISRIRRRFSLITMGFFDFSSDRKIRKKYNQPLDFYFPNQIIKDIQKIVYGNKIDTVIVEYVILSKIFNYLPNSINKIIDTHDKFTDRFDIYLKQGLEPSWTSLNKNDEIKGLNRADSIICLNSNELDFYKKNGLRAKNCVYYNLSLKKDLSKKGDINNLLYLASANDINKQSINDFLDNYFIEMLKKSPQLKLYVGGEISNYINLKHDNIILLGFVSDLENFYSQGRIVINPEVNGTGQKIKSIEALRYNKLLVSTTEIGIEDSRKLFFHCNNYDEMSNILISILSQNTSAEEKYIELEKSRRKQANVLKSIIS